MVRSLRHQTAMSRRSLSRPVRIAYESGLIDSCTSFFDYGCGRGDDIRFLSALGVPAHGWDPALRPDGKKEPAHVVNLGYVVNVIEDPRERDATLQEAWGLTKSVLVVAARLTFEKNGTNHDEFADGCLTGRGTFQKFYTQDELRDWVKEALNAEPVAAAPGVLILFREPAARLRFEASRWRRRASIPGQQLSDKVFEANEKLLEPLMTFVADRGRLPDSTELPESVEICQEFGSLKRAFGVITHATGSEKWDKIHEQRKTDLMVYLALDRFGGRPKFTDLPQELQWDIKALFRSYTQACSHADELLFSAGNMEAVNAVCASVEVGKLTQEALYVHRTALESLPELLRVYEGCARAYIGNVEGANIVKLNRAKPNVSYLAYPEFDSNPHPALEGSLVVSLRSLKIRHFDYRQSENPPILHRKEEFVPADYPGREKFVRLTRQEERHALFDDPVRIGTRDGWNQVLVNQGIRLSGHRVVRRRLTKT